MVWILLHGVLASLSLWNLLPVTYRADTDGARASLLSLTSEQELPTPSAIEEKVPQRWHCWLWIMTCYVCRSARFWTKMHDLSWLSPNSKSIMRLSEWRNGWRWWRNGTSTGTVRRRVHHSDAWPLCDIPDSVRQSSVCAIGLHVYLHVEFVLFFLLLGSGGFPFLFFFKALYDKMILLLCNYWRCLDEWLWIRWPVSNNLVAFLTPHVFCVFRHLYVQIH